MDGSNDVSQRFECEVCGMVYDEKVGLPNEGIPEETPWDELPGDFICPDCGAPHSVFRAF